MFTIEYKIYDNLQIHDENWSSPMHRAYGKSML